MGTSEPSAFELALRDLPAIAILRAAGAVHLMSAAETLFAEGFRVLEFPLTTPGALDALRRARKQLPAAAVVGAGTVLTADDARAAIDAGAQLLVSPALCAEAMAVGVRAGVPTVPGAFTPTEILAAQAGGATLVKLFPAAVVGPQYLAALRQPLPGVRIVPTGGVSLDNARAWFAAGAVALGLGSPLLGDSLETGDLSALRSSARAWVAELSRARPALPNSS